MPFPSRLFRNPLRRARAGFTPREIADVAAFARERPPTPLVDAAGLAATLGLARLFIKDETARWDLNAFKITGASYALDRWRDANGERLDNACRLICASAGNHGRAIARAARERGLSCQVFLPSDALPARVEAIRGEGAHVVRVDGTYEDALARAAEAARAPGTFLVSDTSADDAADAVKDAAPGIPDLIVRGYSRVFAEAAAAWDAPPDVLVVQGGVGGLVAAAAGWMRTMLPDAMLIAAEPEGAACLMESARAGRLTSLGSTRATSMVCLRCAEPSAAAWPFVASGVDAFVAVTDAEAAGAVRALASEGIAAGASGACGLAALTAVAPELRSQSALIVVTEGP